MTSQDGAKTGLMEGLVEQRRRIGSRALEQARHGIGRWLRPRELAGMDHRARGAERNRRALLASVVAMLARVVQIGTLLVTVRVTLRYLGNERFGLWMTINSILAMAAFADFGMGLGVLNAVAHAHGKDDFTEIRKAISSGFAALSLIAAILMLSFFGVYRFIDWGGFFHVTSPLARAESGPALAVFVTCFALNISLDLVQRVQLGLQQGYSNSVWQLCGTLTGFVAVITGIWLHASLPALVAAIAGGPVLGVTLNNLYFFGYVRRDLAPRPSFASREAIRKIARLGGMFFVSQMVVAITFSADNVIIARTLGAAAVAQFSVPQRMFSIVGVIATILVTPLWPAYGEALSRGDMAWVRRTLSRSLQGVLLLTALISATLLYFSHRILLLWVGPSIRPPLLLLLGLAVWAVMQSVTGTLQAFLNGGSILRFMAVIHCVFAVVCLPVKLWLAQRYGIVAMPWGTIVPYGLIVVLSSALYVPRLIKRMTVAAQVTVEQPPTLTSFV